MTPAEQEALFVKVQKRWPHWSEHKVSGYVHGVMDEARYVRPHRYYVTMYTPKHSYSVGYIFGFIDARGEDAFTDPQLKRFKSQRALAYEWWKNESETT